MFDTLLIQEISQPAGTVYPILGRLEELGWLEGEWEDYEEKDRSRRRRKYYRLTKEGKTDGKKYFKAGIKELDKLGLLAPAKTKSK